MSFYSSVSTVPEYQVVATQPSTGVAVDSNGNIYVAQSSLHRINKITSAGVVTTLAGSSQGFAEGSGSAAKFSLPRGVAVDSGGNVYVTDSVNKRIRRITPAGVVTTFAGSATAGSLDGQGTAAQFNTPYGITVDSGGNFYVSDSGNHRIRKITPAGVVTTLAGDGTAGYLDGQGTAAQFNQPAGVAVDSGGNVYVAERGNKRIRKITPAGVVTTLAGDGTAGYLDGQGSAAQFNQPFGVAVDSSGNVYVADTLNNRIRKITSTGAVSTFAGSSSATAGSLDGQGSTAQFNGPFGIAINSSGIVYIVEGISGTSKIRKIELIPCSQPTGTQYVAATCTDTSNTVFSTPPNCTAGQFFSGFKAGSSTSTGSPGTCTPCSEPTGTQFVTAICTSTTNTVFSNTPPPTCTTGGILKNFSAGSSTTLGSLGVCSSPCNAGSYNNNGVCEPCPSGLFSVAGALVCSAACPVGTLAIIGSACMCPAGKWYNISSLQCNTCPSGTFYVGSGATSMSNCMSCGSGTYSGIGSPSCLQCPVGTSFSGSRGTSSAVCTPCPAGQYSNITGSSACSTCPVGTSSIVGSSFCYRATSEKRVMTFAGSGSSAQFTEPCGVAVDSNGNFYVADRLNNLIRKITPSGAVSTLAGSSWGFADGQGSAAQFKNPVGVAVDSNGNVYVADTDNHRIRKITPAGVVTTLAGDGNASFLDGQGSATRFNYPHGVAVDSGGNVYVADKNNNRIRKITSTGAVSTLAGSATSGSLDGTGSAAQFNQPFGVAVDSSGNVYVAEWVGRKVRKITSSGVVSTLAETGGLMGITLDSNGNIYVADTLNNQISKITPSGTVSVLAGSGTVGYLDGSVLSSQFNHPIGVAVDSGGNVYVADKGNNKIRKITDGIIEDRGLYVMHTFYTTIGQFTTLGNMDIYDELVITATNVYSKGPRTLAAATYTIDPNQSTTGLLNRGSVYTTDYGTFQSGTVQYVIVYLKTPCPASTPKWDPLQRKCVAACSIPLSSVTSNVCTKCSTLTDVLSIPDTSVKFNSPYGVAIDSGGNVYVADTGNNRIRKITPNGISTLAGSGTAGYLDGSGLSAQFRGPVSVAVDSSDNIYVSDSGNHRIRKITSAGVVTTLAGSGSALFLDGSGTNASFSRPGGIAVDSAGNVYVGDIDNHRVRKITSAGVVTTLAGSTTAGYLDGQGTAAQFNQPAGVAVDSGGNVYVADILNNNIRKITSAGVVTTLAGGSRGSLDGQGTTAQFYYPCSVAVDSSGTVYVADPDNHKVRKITPSGTVTTLAGGSQGLAALFNYPRGIAVDSAGYVYVADTGYNRIRKITPSGALSTYDTAATCESGFTLSGTTCNGTSLTCPDQSWTLSGYLCTKTELRCPTGSILMPQKYCLFSNGLSALQTSVDLIQYATSTPVSKPAYGACVTDCPVNSYKNEDCVQCPGNQVTASTGATSVTECVCPVGTYGTNGSGVCTPCGQDQTSPQGTQTQSGCVMYCPVGSYASSTSTCTVCPYGSSQAGSMSVSACTCAPGTFLNAGTCVAQCPIGMYGDNGSRLCIQCPGNQTSALGAVGISACVCPDGSGGLNGSGVCTPCTGGQASTMTTSTCPDDTWTLTGSVCSKVSDYDCAGISYDDLIESGQLLEPVEIDIGTATQRSFTKQPTGVSSVFTFSIDLQIQNNTTNYRHIFQNIPGFNWPIDTSDKGKPLLVLYDRSIWLRYSTNPGGPPSDYNFAIGSNFVPGDWFKCTCTVDGPNKTITMYINGVKQSQQTVIGGNLIAPTAAPSFTWRSQTGDINNGYMKVKNVYWWNQVLPSDAIKLFAGLSVPGACYKTANTCYSTTYTCPTSACTLSRYTCPDASWTLNGSVCLKSGQSMTAPTVTCSCPVSPPQYTCPAGWTLDGTRCRTTNPTYYSCDNEGSENNPNTPTTGWTTVKSARKLEGDRCRRYTCSADTSQSGTYLTIDGNSCKFYNSTYVCQTGYRQEPYAGSFQTALAEIPGCNKWSHVPDDYDVVVGINPYTRSNTFIATSRERDYCAIDYIRERNLKWGDNYPNDRRPVYMEAGYTIYSNVRDESTATRYSFQAKSYNVVDNICYPIDCPVIPANAYNWSSSGNCNNAPLLYDTFIAILADTYRAVPYYTTIPTTVADDIAATPQYDYRPADPVMSDINAQDAKLTRTQAQVMAIQTTNATTGSVQGRQCMCSGTQYMDLLNKNCVNLCPVATYADSATRTCQPCRANTTSPEGSTSSAQCVCSYATPYWSGFSCMQELNASAVVTGSGFTTRYENKYTIHEFTQSGSFTLLSPTFAKLLLVGGGAGGSSDGYPGGGGTVTNVNDHSLSGGTYNVTVGAEGGPNSAGGNTSLTGPGTNFTANGGSVLTSLTSLTSFRFINLGASTILYCACANPGCTPPLDSFYVTNNSKVVNRTDGVIKTMNEVNTSPAPTEESCAQACLDTPECIGFAVDLRYNLSCSLYNFNFVAVDSQDQRYTYMKKTGCTTSATNHCGQVCGSGYSWGWSGSVYTCTGDYGSG